LRERIPKIGMLCQQVWCFGPALCLRPGAEYDARKLLRFQPEMGDQRNKA